VKRLAIAVALTMGATAAASPSVRWDQLFSADGAPSVHARVRYRDAAGAEHRLELWRTAKAVRRDTDDKLTLVVEHKSGGNDEYHVIHRGEDRGYDVSRNALYRMGSFPQWVQLATLLTRPDGDVTVTTMQRPQQRTAVGACRWYEARTPQAAERICWSPALKLPFIVEREHGGAWEPVITVDEARTGRIAPSAFATNDGNTRRVDIDRDLD
jgi:hypothetical protein